MRALERALRKWPNGTYVSWRPIREAQADSRFLNSVAALGAPNILRLELDVGSGPIGAQGQEPLARAGLLIVNPPHTLIDEARTLMPWLAETLSRGGRGRHLCAWLTEPELSARRLARCGRFGLCVNDCAGWRRRPRGNGEGVSMALPNVLKDKLRLPVIGAPLFIISHPALVIAQCKAGIVGAFPALNARPISQLDEWLHEITEALSAHDRAHPERPAAPFAVNQIVHKSNARLEEDMALTVKWKAPIVITSLGAREDVNAAVHGYGGITLHDIINDRFAHKAIEKGADGLIAVAAGAGGHAGPVSPFALIQDIRAWFDGPLLLSGAIATGRAVLAAQVMGADLAYIGSAFVATAEARAIDAYKQAIVDGDASDIVGSSYFTGVFGNYLKSSIVKSGLDPDSLPLGEAKAMNFASSGSSGAKPWRDIWGSGQGIGAVKTVAPAAELVARLEREYAQAKAKVCA